MEAPGRRLVRLRDVEADDTTGCFLEVPALYDNGAGDFVEADELDEHISQYAQDHSPHFYVPDTEKVEGAFLTGDGTVMYK